MSKFKKGDKVRALINSAPYPSAYVKGNIYEVSRVRENCNIVCTKLDEKGNKDNAMNAKHFELVQEDNELSNLVNQVNGYKAAIVRDRQEIDSNMRCMSMILDTIIKKYPNKVRYKKLSPTSKDKILGKMGYIGNVVHTNLEIIPEHKKEFKFSFFSGHPISIGQNEETICIGCTGFNAKWLLQDLHAIMNSQYPMPKLRTDIQCNKFGIVYDKYSFSYEEVDGFYKALKEYLEE